MQSLAQAVGALGDRAAEGHRHVTAELAQGGHPQPAITGLPGRLVGGVQVGPRRGEALQAFERAGPREERTSDQLGRFRTAGGAEGLAEECLGVDDPAPTDRGRPGEQERPGGPGPVLDGERVDADGLRGRRQQVGGPAVVQSPGGDRRGHVQDLVDQVVGELVGRARLDQQPRRRGLFAPPRGVGRVHPEQVRHDSRVHPGAEDRAGPEDLLHGLAEPTDPGDDSGLQRFGDVVVACGQAAQDLDDEEGVASGPALDRRFPVRVPGASGELGDVHGRQRPEVEPARDRVQGREDRSALLEAHRRHDEQPGVAGPQRQVVQQLRRGQPRVVQVVEDQQHRPGSGEGAQQGADRLEGASGVGRRRVGVREAERLGEVGEESAEDPGVGAGRGP